VEIDTLITGATIVDEDGLRNADIGVQGEQIVGLFERSSAEVVARKTIDAQGLHVLPGVIDPHTHIGLGSATDWLSETEAAVRGGVTTVINYVMGGSSYFSLVADEHAAAAEATCVDYALHVVPCTEEHLHELPRYARELGVTSFKYFMSFRGNEGAYLGVSGTDDGYLYRYLRLVAELPGSIANVHPENIEVVWTLRDEVRTAGLDGLEGWDASRPDFVEAEALGRAAYLAACVGAPLYLVHISAAKCLEEIRRARQRIFDGPPLYAETCPHYLTHHVASPVASLGKVNPPLRRERDCEALWEGLKDGTIETVGSDHVPRRRELKEKSIWEATAGIAGLGTTLAVLISEGYHKHGLDLPTVTKVTSSNAARIFGIYPQKGAIRVGSDADLVLVDLDEERSVTADTWGGGAGYNLYEGWRMKGWPRTTMLRGQIVYDAGNVSGSAGVGRYLRRELSAG
jgi:dihydropyrimidinase